MPVPVLCAAPFLRVPFGVWRQELWGGSPCAPTSRHGRAGGPASGRCGVWDGVLSRRPDFFRHVGISGRWNAFLMYFFQHGEELVRRLHCY